MIILYSIIVKKSAAMPSDFSHYNIKYQLVFINIFRSKTLDFYAIRYDREDSIFSSLKLEFFKKKIIFLKINFFFKKIKINFLKTKNYLKKFKTKTKTI